ncbi:MAG: recombinase family protein, partial [Armatimonadota bacterium]
DTIVSPGAASTIIAIKGLTNEIEIEANAHRSRRGLAGRVLAGYHAGGAPYGYRTRPVHDDKPGDPPGTGPVRGHEYIIHQGEADTIRRIFRMYVKGMSTRQIAAQLNAEGVSPPGARWKDRQGVRRTWSHGALFGDPKRGQGILNNVKYIGQLVWNHSTWPRDPERDGKQVRRELPEDQWVVQDAPHLRIVPQQLWEAARVRMARRSRERVGEAHHAKHPRLLSGLLVCGKCGGRFVLRGSRIYSCSSRQNRGAVVCDCMATVNAAEAEDRIIAELQDLFCNEELVSRITERARRLAAERRTGRQQKRSTTTELRRQLTQTDREITRLLDAIGKGALVDDLMERMQAAEARRDNLRQELGEAQKTEAVPGIELLPAAVRRVVADLRQMLAAGQVERVRTALCRLVTRIEVHEEERPGRKRPGAYLLLRGNLEAALELTGAKSTSGCSPGGIWTPLIFRLPPRRIRLLDRHSHNNGPEQRRLAAGGG